MGVLCGVPLVGSLIGVGPIAYLLPLGVFLVAVFLRVVASGRPTASPEVAVYAGVVVVFLAWMSATALWAIPGLNPDDDLQLLAALVAFVVVAAFALDEDAIETGIYAMLVAAVLAAGYVFWSYISQGTLRGYGALQGQYLLVAQLVGLGTVLSVLRALTTQGIERRFNVVCAVVLLAGLGLSLARGALLSAMGLSVMGAFYANVLERGSRKSFQAWLRRFAARAMLFVSVLGAVGIAVGSALRVERTRLRLIRLVSGGELSEGERIQMWRRAWENISTAPVFGHGLGSSGVMSGRGPDLYPHNWVLQVWLDGGMLGLVLCLTALAIPILFAVPLGRGRPRSAVARWLPLGGAYAFLVLEYSKSSDFYTARLLLVIGAAWIYSVRPPRSA